MQDLETWREVLKKSKNVLFVVTKPQIAPIIAEVAQSYGAHYVNTRWIVGLLTNWPTMVTCLNKLKDVDQRLERDPQIERLSKKEILQLKKQRDRLEKFFGGIRHLKTLPDLVIIVGQPHERNAVAECHKLNIPTITFLDSNCDPSLSSYGIPANDDSTRSVRLILTELTASPT
jgi:small subunit ribosomal protein S2